MICVNLRRALAGALVLIVVSGGLGYYRGRLSAPPKEVTRIQREVVTQMEERRVTTKRPDGTKVTEVTISTNKQAVTDTKKEKTPQVLRNEWAVGVYTSSRRTIVATIDRRIIGDLFVGVYGRVNTEDLADREVGLGLRYEF